VTSTPALQTSQPQALDCWENHSSLCVRSTPASPLRTSPATRGSVLAPLQTSPPNKPAEGSGLLGESQLSLRAEHAYPHSPPKPGHARLRTSPSPHTLRTSQPKALDCCQHYSSLSRTECACPPSPYKYHAREAPYSHLSPPALSNLKSQIPLSPSRQNTNLRPPPPNPQALLKLHGALHLPRCHHC
jgi:hypothetical protein